MRTRLFLFVLLVLLASCVALAQEDWNITGAGARAEGLGGAFIGLADDATAISWNPAGLGQLERTEFSAVGRWISEQYKREGQNRTGNFDITQTHFTYNFASIAFPLHAGKVNIVPAVAFQKKLDNYSKYELADEDYEAGGGVNTLTPGIGIKLHPMIYLGGAVNIWLGNFDNTTTDKTSAPFGKTENNGSYKGLNFTAGFLVDFEGMKTPVPIKLGATVRTPFDLTVDGDYTESSGARQTGKGSFDNTVQVPLMYGFGASVRPFENLTLACDFESRLYGDRNIYRSGKADGSATTLRDTLKLSASEKDLHQIRVGAEFLIVTSAGVIPLRAGFHTVPTLRADWNANGDPDGQVSGTGFSVGTGFIGGVFAFDVTYSQMSWEQSFQVNPATIKYLSQTVSASAIVYF
jgi:hypothetical protein